MSDNDQTYPTTNFSTAGFELWIAAISGLHGAYSCRLIKKAGKDPLTMTKGQIKAFFKDHFDKVEAAHGCSKQLIEIKGEKRSFPSWCRKIGVDRLKLRKKISPLMRYKGMSQLEAQKAVLLAQMKKPRPTEAVEREVRRPTKSEIRSGSLSGLSGAYSASVLWMAGLEPTLMSEGEMKVFFARFEESYELIRRKEPTIVIDGEAKSLKAWCAAKSLDYYETRRRSRAIYSAGRTESIEEACRMAMEPKHKQKRTPVWRVVPQEITVDGKTLRIEEWARAFGTSPERFRVCLYRMIKKGSSPESALQSLLSSMPSGSIRSAQRSEAA